MKDKNVELARQWLEKANHDLITAKQTLALPDGPTDTPCFHAQQAIKKALKALLTSHQIVFPKNTRSCKAFGFGHYLAPYVRNV